jgi:hypothetical protein
MTAAHLAEDGDDTAGRGVAGGGEEGILRVVGAVVLGLWVRWS